MASPIYLQRKSRRGPTFRETVLVHGADTPAGLAAVQVARLAGAKVLATAGSPAGRVLVAARKGARGPLRLLAPLITHAAPRHDRDAEDLTPLAAQVLRDGAPIAMGIAKAA